MFDVASAKSTFSPATELSAMDALEKSAAKVNMRGYGKHSESIGRNKSSDVIRWFRGNEEMRDAVAETIF